MTAPQGDRVPGGVPRDELQALTKVFEEAPVPGGLRRRLIEAADPAPAPGRRFWAAGLLGLATGVALTLAILGWPQRAARAPERGLVVDRAERDRAARPDAAVVADVDAGPCRATVDETSVAISSDCRVDLDELGVRIHVWEAATLSRAGRTIAIHEGAASFEIDPIDDAPPIEIDVGAGLVRVLGTRFEIQNIGVVGHLDLIRGRVQFLDQAGRVHDVSPGHRLSWDRRTGASSEAVPETAPSSPPPGPEAESDAPGHRAARSAASPPPDDTASREGAAPDAESSRPGDLDDTLAEVARLRHARAYREAESLLRRALRDAENPHAAQVISFEIGTLLELADSPSEACAHWRRHITRYGTGRSGGRARSHLKRLACDVE